MGIGHPVLSVEHIARRAAPIAILLALLLGSVASRC